MKSPFRAAVAAMSVWLAAAVSAAPLVEFRPGERIALVGGSLAERMNLYGHFETLLHLRHRDAGLVVRNFAWPADEVGRRQRPNDYTKIDDPLEVFRPDTFLCFFGFNESFAGPGGVEKFQTDYEAFMDDFAKRYGPEGRARFVIVSPIAFEDGGVPVLPDGAAENANLRLYADAAAAVARKRGLPFVELLAPTLRAFAAEPGAQYTINGCHLNEAGDRLVGRLLEEALAGAPNPAREGEATFEALRAAVNDKAWVHLQDYRMLNGWYVYGGRRTWDTETFPLEYKKIRAMAAVRDRRLWDMSRGLVVSGAPDDSVTGELFLPKTRFGVPQQSYSEPKELRFQSGEESLKAMTVADGYEVSLFASEEQFPEMGNPVQMNFDSRGRLWVATMPTYPQWKPGDPKPQDKLLIFEDTNGDGRADKCITFHDGLHCPTGFEFWNGGVLVVSQPRLLWLKDTDGDDRADVAIPVSDGWAMDDTHHTFGAWEWSPGGLLHGLEGVAMSTTLETPWGPFRNANTPGAYVVDPRSWRVRHFITPGYGNPWCYVYDFWGQ
ncbi:MAG TPA: GDSL-type esterase/lipase family protein, partial [Verrucomicrobiota bacterium]|nr:GDSL-type esterase/lipase family protein [Verrucomicrobiota bacterium]